MFLYNNGIGSEYSSSSLLLSSFLISFTYNNYQIKNEFNRYFLKFHIIKFLIFTLIIFYINNIAIIFKILKKISILRSDSDECQFDNILISFSIQQQQQQQQ